MKITKKQVNAIYSQPINPLKPFERLDILMAYLIQKLQINLKK